MMQPLRNERGQTATEYILMISVVVLGLLAASSLLLPSVKDGVDSMSQTLKTRFQNNPTTVCDPAGGGNCD